MGFRVTLVWRRRHGFCKIACKFDYYLIQNLRLADSSENTNLIRRKRMAGLDDRDGYEYEYDHSKVGTKTKSPELPCKKHFSERATGRCYKGTGFN